MVGAIMGRTSHEIDDAFSVSAQIDDCIEYAARNHITIPSAYSFREDFSGKLLDRPELNKIRALVRERKIHALIIYAVDRLARKVGVGEIILDELIEHGVQLHIVAWGTDVKDTPEDHLRFNFETTFSDFERRKIAKRTTDGKKKKAKLGFVVGNNRPLYGYALNKTKDTFVITDHARYVRDILLMFGVHHIRPIDILSHLEVSGAPTPGSLEYQRLKTLYDERLAAGRINEEEYAQKLARAKRFLGHNRWNLSILYRLIAEVDTYAGKYTFTVSGESYTVPVPAIISEEEAEEVRKMRAVTRTRFARKREVKHDFLLARRLRCEHCKRTIDVSYSQEGYLYYRCSGNSKRAYHVCSEKPIPANLLDDKAREFIRELLLNPRRLFAWWQEQHNATAEERERIEQDIETLAAKVRTTTEKYHRTLDKLTDNLDPDEVAYYSVQRDSLKTLRTEYQEELDQLLAKCTTVDIDETVVTDFMQMGKEYEEVLKTSTSFPFWRGLVDDLDITAVIGQAEERRFIEFLLFKKVRRKFYLIEKPSVTMTQSTMLETQTSEHSTTTITIPKNAIR